MQYKFCYVLVYIVHIEKVQEKNEYTALAFTYTRSLG